MDDVVPPPLSRPCAICGKPVVARFRPFCSARCRMIDLGRWLNGSYSVPAAEDPDDEAPSPPDEG